MKKLLIIAMGLFLFASCDKEHEGPPCPTVAADAVPAAVTKAFQDKHPGTTAKTWYNKDNKSFVAQFDSNGKEALDFFDNNGNFQNEEIDGDNQQGDHQDGDDDDGGCECGTED